MADGGFSDKIQILKESTYGDGGAAGEKVFGVTKEFTWAIDTSSIITYGLESSGPAGTAITDGVMAVSGSHTWELTDGRELECIMGTLVDSNPGFTLDVSNALPSYSVKAVDDAGDATFVIIKGVKYTSVSIALSRDETIQVTADWIGKTVEDGSTFTPTVSAIEPLTYLDGYFALGVTALPEMESVSLKIDRAVTPQRFIESTAANARRLISKAVEGVLSVTFDGTVSARREVLDELFGDTTIQDLRVSKAMSLNIARGTASALVLNLANARVTTGGRTLDKEAELALMDMSGIALDISGLGTYAS
jgi:hypothetical protein